MLTRIGVPVFATGEAILISAFSGADVFGTSIGFATWAFDGLSLVPAFFAAFALVVAADLPALFATVFTAVFTDFAVVFATVFNVDLTTGLGLPAGEAAFFVALVFFADFVTLVFMAPCPG